MQPYPSAPDYREFTGRLFGEAAAANNEDRFGNITAPAALAVGSFSGRARPGDTFASYGVLFFNLDSNNQPDIPNLRLVLKDLIQVRFLLAGTDGVFFDIRKGTLTPAYQDCIESRLPRWMYLPDGRGRALAQCERAAFWSWWMRDTVYPLKGSFAVDRITTLDYEWDAAAGEMRMTLR